MMPALYTETTRQPVALERLLRDDILVRRYVRPDATAAGIIIPEQARADRTQTLWEVLAAAPGAEEALGMRLRAGDIIQTLRRWPRDLHLVTEDGSAAMLWSVGCQACPEHPKGARICGLRGISRYD